MKQETKEQFTKYEIARIIGARALQIAMDAPLLIKITDDELKNLRYDALKIAEHEFDKGVLPISVKRPTPQKRKEKLLVVKEEKVSDEELIEKEKEVEKEIIEDAETLGFATEEETESAEIETTAGEE